MTSVQVFVSCSLISVRIVLHLSHLYFTGIRETGTSKRYSDWLKPNPILKFIQLLGFWRWNNPSCITSEIHPQSQHNPFSGPYIRNLTPRNNPAPEGGVVGLHINQSRHSMYWSAVCNKPRWRCLTVAGVGRPVTLTILQPSPPLTTALDRIYMEARGTYLSLSRCYCCSLLRKWCVLMTNSIEQRNWGSLSWLRHFPLSMYPEEVHYHVHKRPQLVPVLIQKNSVHTLTPISLILYFHLCLRFPRRLFPSRFSTETSYAILISCMRATRLPISFTLILSS